ncbi:MAG: hypothetical protein JXC32_04355 [Anaerolineae bacterium]|nr:hypothetical protein [Anaerolineae bacterium]
MTVAQSESPVVVVISADVEWEVARPRLIDLFGATDAAPTPYGAVMVGTAETAAGRVSLRFTHGGWGKIDAAASAQHAIDRWAPSLLINLGTCGGFEGAIARDTVILVTRTLVYDIVEQMGDPDAALDHYAVDIDLTWLREPYPLPVWPGLLLSADRDLVPAELPALQRRFGGVAGDWESGAIAHVAARNGTRCLILRGVTDMVGSGGGESYDGTGAFFRQSATTVMARLVASLPAWLSCVAW